MSPAFLNAFCFAHRFRWPLESTGCSTALEAVQNWYQNMIKDTPPLTTMITEAVEECLRWCINEILVHQARLPQTPDYDYYANMSKTWYGMSCLAHESRAVKSRSPRHTDSATLQHLRRFAALICKTLLLGPSCLGRQPASSKTRPLPRFWAAAALVLLVALRRSLGRYPARTSCRPVVLRPGLGPKCRPVGHAGSESHPCLGPGSARPLAKLPWAGTGTTPDPRRSGPGTGLSDRPSRGGAAFGSPSPVTWPRSRAARFLFREAGRRRR